MKVKQIMKKINFKNLIILGLVVIIDVIALFSSPFYLGSNYSKKVLIDDYCSNNLNGSSLVIKTDLNHSSCDYDSLMSFKLKNDSEYNNMIGYSLDEVLINDKQCNLVSAKQSNLNSIYNQYRVYSDNRWDKLKNDNYIYVPQDMVSDFVSDPKKIVDVDVSITINGVVYPFKIGGFYNTSITNSGWRSRGSYFNNSFSNCVFVSENFLSDKFTCVFDMLTSDTQESGYVYNNFVNYVNGCGGKVILGGNFKENNLLGKLDTLNKTSRNKILQTVMIIASSIVMLLILLISIYLFNVEKVKLSRRKYALFVWLLAYFSISCLFVLVIKNKLINLFGFSAFGSNEALLNIVLIFTVLFAIAVSIKTFIKYKKDLEITRKEELKDNKGTVVFVTKAKFPDDNAFATYIGSIASVYKKYGYNVICIGSGYTKKKEVQESYFGKYVSLRSSGNSFISKVINQLLFEWKVYLYLKNNIEHPVHIFFSCEYSYSFYTWVRAQYYESGVNYSYIITEEYTKDEFEDYNVLSRKAFKINHYFVNDYYNENDSFIVISKYLFNKISKREMKCVYVPFCFDYNYISSLRQKPVKHTGINYIYCGNPENKDLLPTIIETFSNLGEMSKKNDVHFNIIGVNEEWATKHNVLQYDKNVISFFGRQNKEFILNKYAESDYSVLLRDEEKVFAKAGFPTKISESLALGVTPICNLSSNLSDILNENNSIIINGHGSSELLESIKFSINDIKKNIFRKTNAIKTAENELNIELYANDLLSIIKK